MPLLLGYARAAMSARLRPQHRQEEPERARAPSRPSSHLRVRPSAAAGCDHVAALLIMPTATRVTIYQRLYAEVAYNKSTLFITQQDELTTYLEVHICHRHFIVVVIFLLFVALYQQQGHQKCAPVSGSGKWITT